MGRQNIHSCGRLDSATDFPIHGAATFLSGKAQQSAAKRGKTWQSAAARFSEICEQFTGNSRKRITKTSKAESENWQFRVLSHVCLQQRERREGTE